MALPGLSLIHILNAFSKVSPVEKIIFLCPTEFPFLAVIRMTPLAAMLPYNAAAGAPFKILMLSTSSGFRLDIPSPVSYTHLDVYKRQA